MIDFDNKAENHRKYINEFRTVLIFINIISLFIIILYDYFYSQYSFEILLMIFVYFILLNNYALNQKIFLLNMDRDRYLYLKVLEASSKFLFPIIFYFYFQSLEAILYGIIFGYIISLTGILLSFLKEYKYTFTIRWDNLKKYFLFAYPIIFVSVFTWGISFSDRYFINYYLSMKDVAIYSLLAIVAGVGQIIGQNLEV